MTLARSRTCIRTRRAQALEHRVAGRQLAEAQPPRQPPVYKGVNVLRAIFHRVDGIVAIKLLAHERLHLRLSRRSFADADDVGIDIPNHRGDAVGDALRVLRLSAEARRRFRRLGQQLGLPVLEQVVAVYGKVVVCELPLKQTAAAGCGVLAVVIVGLAVQGRRATNNAPLVVVALIVADAVPVLPVPVLSISSTHAGI